MRWIIIGAIIIAAIDLVLMYAAVLVASNDDRRWKR